MEEKVEPTLLNRESLCSMLEKQLAYQASEGKLGQRVDLSVYIIEDYDFSGIDLSSIFAIDSTFYRCKFVNCDLYSTIFTKSKFIEVDFTGANLGKTEFCRVKARNACFDNTNCGSAEFDEADLSGTTFRNANLNGASFVDCDLTNAIFDGAKLTWLSTGGNNKWDNTSFLNIEGENPVPGL